MDSLISIAARASLESHRVPTECLEQMVEASRVYGLLININDDDDQPYMYEGFYSSRARAERRAEYLFPFFCQTDEQFANWMRDPTEQRRLTKERGDWFITEHILSPHHSRVVIHVYFSNCGYVTNIPIDVDDRWHVEFTLDQFEPQITTEMREYLLSHLNDMIADTMVSLTQESKKRLYDTYGLTLEWQESGAANCDCTTCIGQSRSPGFTGEHFEGLRGLLWAEFEESDLDD